MKSLIFNKAYVINLPDRRDRMKNARKQLNRYKIPNLRIPGVILDDKEKACKLAHINAMRTALKENKTPLILEDDFYIQKGFEEKLEIFEMAFLKDVTEWDLFYLYCDRYSIRKQINKYIYDASTYGGHAYIVNKNSIEKIIQILYRNNDALDRIFKKQYRKNKIKSFCTTEQLICQDIKFNSSIVNYKWEHGEFNGYCLDSRKIENI